MGNKLVDAIRAANRSLTEVYPHLEKESAKIADKDHLTVIRYYAQIKDVVEEMEAIKTTYEALKQKLSRDTVPDAMRRDKIKNIAVFGVGMVSIGHRFSCSMLDKTEGFKWLRKNKLGDLIIETVNSSTLSAWANKRLTMEGKELPSDIFKTSTSPYTSITKLNGKNNDNQGSGK